MKKIVYQTPEVKVKALYMEQLMAGSVTSDDLGIGYGGVDSDGSQDPDAKSDLTIKSVWDD